jgi:hypothetical protein
MKSRLPGAPNDFFRDAFPPHWFGPHKLHLSRSGKLMPYARVKWNECNFIAFGFVMGGMSAGVLEAVLALNSKLFLGSDGRLQIGQSRHPRYPTL